MTESTNAFENSYKTNPNNPLFRILNHDENLNIRALRRNSVSAECMEGPESMDPTFHETSTFIPKSNEVKLHIEAATSNNLLFKNLELEQRDYIINAMFERSAKAGETVIQQGDNGDNFYVIESGSFSVYVDGEKKVDLGPGQSFGELALMYNTPRAATVIANQNSMLWAVDRLTFRKTIHKYNYFKRKLYEGFLKTVPILTTLSESEISKIADCLEPVEFDKAQVIIKQGDTGDAFYIIVNGSASVTVNEQEVNKLGPGDYFGEMALINQAPRKATVTALEPTKCVTFEANAFIRLFGPLLDIMKRNMTEYEKYKDLAPTPPEP